MPGQERVIRIRRPYLVMRADRFARALAPAGAVDQWADGADLPGRPCAVRAMVGALG
ncbi:hypothetical protein [Streptomyces sp. FH025]|uniref:hypothetical protein n=1 Tax=Streptomyces sp. FH025 TaxID=2815937 RepID=UPI001A9D9317|nr:hypothetical protein [Streptomyces sp. FH025]MBO1420063.1 hypothetical protein [Streptomyces sp. FH025]